MIGEEPGRPDPLAGGRRRRLSLRTRFLAWGILLALGVVTGSTVLTLLQRGAERRLAAGVRALAEEQRIADQMAQAVLRQLLSVTAPELVGGPEGDPAAFERAGREVHRQIRAFLDRPLAIEERLVLERLREAHQRVEVAAAQGARFLVLGDEARAAEARTQASAQMLAFLGELDAFLVLRSGELQALEEEQARTFQAVLWSRLLLMVLFVVGVTGLTVWARRRFARPLEDLLVASERMAGGDLTVRVAPGRDPEFEAVASGFNEMAVRLEEARLRLQSRNEELAGALDEVRRTQGELIQAEKLAALGRMSAGLAHELNNPLASVIGFGELLENRLREGDPPSPGELEELYLAPLMGEARRAGALIRSFLQFSRRPDRAPGSVPLRATMASIAEMRAPAFARAGLTLDTSGVPEAPVMADPELLKTVFLNLVGNALDAMAPGGRGVLRVHGRVDDAEPAGVVILHFDDEGGGFETVDRVFEPFYTTKAPGRGTGLGLALVHLFVHRFGGSVEASNRPEGGARVTLRLPVARAADEAEDPSAAPRGPAPGGAVGPLPPADGRRPRVLVVDDERQVRLLQRRILERIGVEAVEAASAEEARALIRSGPVDAVVSDVRMPGESGIDLFRWIETENPELARRVLFVTGDMTHPELSLVAAARPEAVILKPFSMEEYSERVARTVRRAGGHPTPP